MTGDASTFGFGADEAEQIAARWETSRRRSGDGSSRLAIVSALLSALDGEAAESIRLATAAAAHGAAYVASNATLSALIDEFDELETLLIDRIGGHVVTGDAPSASAIVSAIRKLHVNAALARRAAVAAFGFTISIAARKRAHVARHDIANAIGTVRNAIQLMDDEAGEGARERFRAIAKRNSQSSETLVRSHLSDRTALTPALGWDVLPLSGVAAHPGDDSASPMITNLSALETMLDAIRAAHGAHGGYVSSADAGDAGDAGTGDTGVADDALTLSFITSSATSGLLTVNVATCNDRATDPNIRAALGELATAIGLRFEDDPDSGAIRLVIPVSGRDERHDVGGTSEGHYADTVRL